MYPIKDYWMKQRELKHLTLVPKADLYDNFLNKTRGSNVLNSQKCLLIHIPTHEHS